MDFFTKTYHIKEDTPSKLTLKLNAKLLILKTVMPVIFYGIFVFYALQNFSLKESKPLVIIILVSIISIFFFLISKEIYTNFNLIYRGDEYVFSKLNNLILHNGQLIAALKKIKKIRINEHQSDEDSYSSFDLWIHFENIETIKLQTSTNPDHIKLIGEKIATLAEIPFSFLTLREQWDLEIIEQEQESLESMTELFEYRFKDKTKAELNEIAKADSPFAEYAKQAAKNLLAQMNS